MSTFSDEQKIYWDIEPHILYDYVNFANSLRPLQVSDNNYKRYTPQQDGYRWYLILFTEAYQKSLEDLGVMLLALCRRFNQDGSCKYQKAFSVEQTPITYTLINYKTREADIKKTLDYFTDKLSFIQGLHIDDFGKININLVFPNADLQKFYSDFYQNIVDWSADQEKRFNVYNKIKHGAMVVGSAKIFNQKNENAPAAVYADPNIKATDRPLVVHSLQLTEEEIILLRSGVFKISYCIRDMISIYMCKNYPDFLKEKGFASPLMFFKQRRPGVNAKQTHF